MSSTAFPPLSPSEPPRVFGAPTFHTDGDILALGVASDGVLWSVEEPGELRGWSLATRRLIVSTPLESFASLWAFNWAARLLASASDEVTVWEVASASQLASWATPAWITALAFQPGATLLATGHDDGTVRVWDWAEQKPLLELDAHGTEVSALAFSLDRKRLATAGEDKRIHLWDLETGRQVGTLQGHKDRITGLAWHPDNRRLFSSAWDTTVRVWDATTCEPIILLNSHATQVHALALSADGKLLASADSRNDLHVWDTDRNETMVVVREASSEIRCIAFTPDDGRGNFSTTLFAFGSADRLIHLWDSRQGMGGGGVDPLVCRTALALSPEGRRLYSLGSGSDLRVWDTTTGKAALSLDDQALLHTFALSPEGSWLAASHRLSTQPTALLTLHEASTGRRVSACEGQAPPVTALAFRGDGRVLASGGVASSDVWLWEVPSGQPQLLLNEALDLCAVEVLAFHPDGKRLAVAGIDWLATGPRRDGQVVIWDLAERKIVRTLEVAVVTTRGETVQVSCGATALAFSPGGKILACAGLNRVVRLWDIEANAVVRELKGHTETVTALAYSPGGEWLASAGEDRTIRLWHAVSGDLAGAWELDTPIRALVFSPDGTLLYTGNGNTSCYQIEVERILEVV
ncbi:MAG: WD40 repeat domain-containing protein [Gemmataceae bacterium]